MQMGCFVRACVCVCLPVHQSPKTKEKYNSGLVDWIRFMVMMAWIDAMRL